MFGEPATQQVTPPPLPDPLPTPPQFAAGGATKAAGNSNAYAPKGGTLLTSPTPGLGPMPATTTAKKSLLGQ